ncbi:MAG: DUF1398 domain-containing protein [Flavobacterium sp.]|nr:MAG: DUF1398 domain-containing protein [Flavobacterium sp.]
MFTIKDIQEAHRKVKSGTDFPAYIQDLKNLGVENYTSFVIDGHTDFFGKSDYKITSSSKYDTLQIALQSVKEQFIIDLKNHQQGNTDYLTFCNDCAKSGIEKWVVDLQKMTCTYYDSSGIIIFIEQVPE